MLVFVSIVYVCACVCVCVYLSVSAGFFWCCSKDVYCYWLPQTLMALQRVHFEAYKAQLVGLFVVTIDRLRYGWIRYNFFGWNQNRGGSRSKKISFGFHWHCFFSIEFVHLIEEFALFHISIKFVTLITFITKLRFAPWAKCCMHLVCSYFVSSSRDIWCSDKQPESNINGEKRRKTDQKTITHTLCVGSIAFCLNRLQWTMENERECHRPPYIVIVCVAKLLILIEVRQFTWFVVQLKTQSMFNQAKTIPCFFSLSLCCDDAVFVALFFSLSLSGYWNGVSELKANAIRQKYAMSMFRAASNGQTKKYEMPLSTRVISAFQLIAI